VLKQQFKAEKDPTQIDSAGAMDVEMLVMNCKKYNHIMSSVQLGNLVSNEKVQEWN